MKEIVPIIETVLKDLDMYSPEASELVYRTGMVESGYRNIRQIRGPAVSYWQIEPATGQDIIDNYLKYRPKMMNKVIEQGLDPFRVEWSMLTNIPVALSFCRLKYRRDPKPIPASLKEQADYWKRVYNTSGGAGTPEKFIKVNT